MTNTKVNLCYFILIVDLCSLEVAFPSALANMAHVFFFSTPEDEEDIDDGEQETLYSIL